MTTPNNSSPPEFILKLHEMIQTYPEIISFSSNGEEVLIHSYEKFVSSLLPRYFRHKNWRSFVRQMNMYNFKKLNRGLEIYIFVNEMFQAGNQENYQHIRRKQVSRKEIDYTSDKEGKLFLTSMREEYGVCSISGFVFMTLEFQQKAEKSCKQLKRALELISSIKKTGSTRTCASKVKDCSQTISEAAKKLKESVRIQYEHYEECPQEQEEMFLKREKLSECDLNYYKSVLKSNLVKPEPITSGLNLSKFSLESTNKVPSSHQNINSPVKIEAGQRENTFVISNLCSFNSYDRFVSL